MAAVSYSPETQRDRRHGAHIPGDSLHTIHLLDHRPTRARPSCRFSMATPSGDWWVILDLEKRSQAGDGWELTIELGVIRRPRWLNRA